MQEVSGTFSNIQHLHYLQPKKKKKQKKIHGLKTGVFSRLRFINTFEEDLEELTMESSIFELYVPRVLSSCSTPHRMPEEPLNVGPYTRSVKIPGVTPFFTRPTLPQRFPTVSKKKIAIEPVYPSLIPLLMTAKFARVDIRRYDVVCVRNSIRKIAANDEDFVISVVRMNSTLFLRRFAKHHVRNKADVGFQFEDMCTSQSNRDLDYHQLIEGQIAENRILMMGEVDAIRRENGESIELKSKKSNVTTQDKVDWWLQSYLTGTKSIIFGRRDRDDDMVVSKTEEFGTETMQVDRNRKMKMFNRLSCVLRFLFSNVVTGQSYMLRGFRDVQTQRRCMQLYEVIDEADKQKLTFITDELIDRFSV